MPDRVDEFIQYRQQMNQRILEIDHLGIKRFFNLDTAAYSDGALDEKTKELLGLVASMVLRCNDCIDYHILECVKVGWTDEELHDAFNVGLVVGGSIVIPHLRHAVETLDLARTRNQEINQFCKVQRLLQGGGIDEKEIWISFGRRWSQRIGTYWCLKTLDADEYRA